MQMYTQSILISQNQFISLITPFKKSNSHRNCNYINQRFHCLYHYLSIQICMIQNLETGCHAIIDICLYLGYIFNRAYSFTGCYELEFMFSSQKNRVISFPYQIINNKENTYSSVTLQTYKSQKFLLQPKKNIRLNQTCVFRLMVSLQQAITSTLICQVNLRQNDEIIKQANIKFDGIMGVNTYLPVFFPLQSIAVDAHLQTQLLGVKCKKNATLARSSFYSVIDILSLEHNRLSKKCIEISKLNQQNEKSMLCENSIIDQISMIGSRLTLNNYEEIQFPALGTTDLSHYKSIFHRSRRNDKLKIMNLQAYCYEASNFLQVKWKEYVEYKSKFQDGCQLRTFRDRYISDLKYEFNRLSRLPNDQKGQNMEINTSQIIKKLNFVISKKQHQHFNGDKKYDGSLSDIKFKSDHIVVLVHGLGANSNALVLYQRIINDLYPQIIVLNSRANEENCQLKTIEEMGKSLASQLQLFLHHKNIDDIQISFIAHSLGGLIVRAALIHLQSYRFNMKTFISLSCPHFGHLKHTNKLTKLGMIALNKLWHSSVFDSLLFKDSPQIRSCYLYHLAFHPGMSWFQHLQLYGGVNDGYVSQYSAFFEGPNNLKQKNSDKVIKEMQNFFEDSLKLTRVEKYELSFQEERQSEIQQKLYEKILGRGPHLAFLTDTNFVTLVLLNAEKSFKAIQEQNQSI